MMKINKLEIENVKRVKAVKIEPSRKTADNHRRTQQPGQDLRVGQYCLGTGRRPLPPVTGRKRGVGDPRRTYILS